MSANLISKIEIEVGVRLLCLRKVGAILGGRNPFFGPEIRKYRFLRVFSTPDMLYIVGKEI